MQNSTAKPIIGIIGGIGSGKSFVARIFAELGCLVIDSDAQVSDAYCDPEVLRELKNWWGEKVFLASGAVNRSAIAGIVFKDSAELDRLERLLHPWVARARDIVMAAAKNDPQVVAFVWDTPLLLETGLDSQCDAVVFIDSPIELRLHRVMQSRGWNAAELATREKLQSPLDKKREIADYTIVNTADAENIRCQVREILSRILANR